MKIPTSILDRLLWPALLALVAVLGYLLVTLPPMVVAQWRELAIDHPVFSTVYLGMVLSGALLLLFVWGWLAWAIVARLRAKRGTKRLPPPSRLSPAQQKREMRKRLSAADRAAAKAEARAATNRGDVDRPARDDARVLRRRVEELQRKMEHSTLEIVAFGAVSSGKSALLNALIGEDRFATDPRGGTTLDAQEVPLPLEGEKEGRVIVRDTPGLGEVLGQRRAIAATERASDADLVLFVASGALRDFEHEALRELATMEKRIIICLNKEDWYTPEDFDAVLRQVRDQVRGVVPSEDVVPVRARPAAQKRVRILADGTTHEEHVRIAPDISSLEARLREVVQRDGRDLVLANLLLRSRKLSDEARATVRGEIPRE